VVVVVDFVVVVLDVLVVVEVVVGSNVVFTTAGKTIELQSM